MVNSATQKAVIRPVIEPVEGIDAGDFSRLITRAPQVFSHLFASLAVAERAAGSSGKNTARWSILMAAPQAELRLNAQGLLSGSWREPLDGAPQRANFLETWAQWVAQHPIGAGDDAAGLPFVGGWS
ncbi:MAG: hypothetical protein B7Y53_08995, partial [Halothiobacillus sp. 28-55-5]